MTPRVHIRPLDPHTERHLAADVYARCADYVSMETGEPPGETHVTEFFEDVPPGRTLDDALKLGIFDDDRAAIGLIDIFRGYRKPGDWYIGLLMIDPAVRGQGIGRWVLEWIAGAARADGATRLLLCVLEENGRARAFWEKQGFTLHRVTPPWTSGRKTHIRFELQRPVVQL